MEGGVLKEEFGGKKKSLDRPLKKRSARGQAASGESDFDHLLKMSDLIVAPLGFNNLKTH